MLEVNIIGTGNVAWHLARAFGSENDAIVMQVAGRSATALTAFEELAQQTVSIQNLRPADVTIIAVSDDAIPLIAQEIPFNNGLIVHTSGFTEMSALSRKRISDQNKSNRRIGVFYPLQTFSKGDVDLDFSEIPILIEAEDEKDEKTLRTLAEVISKNVKVVQSEQRRRVHLAAVFANNFTNHCYHIAQQICTESDVAFETLHALITKSAQNAVTYGSSDSQTGPAKRKDKKVIAAQLDLLEDASHKEIYTTITRAISETYGKEL